MTSARPADGNIVTLDLVDFVPELRADFVRRDVGGECIVWSPLAAEPAVLDPVATVMLDVVDGEASMGQLALDVCEAVGVPIETAERQVTRIIEQFAQAGLLTASTANSTAEEAITQRELFASSPTPCTENASRLGTATHTLRLGEHTVRVACDSRRGSQKLRAAFADHLADGGEDAALAFVLTAPAALKRTHLLVDRSGFVLSEGRGLDAGLHAMASHLTALLPAAPGTVRIRARGIVSGDRTIVCLFPLLFFPVIGERELARAGLHLIDRLALDIELATGHVANLPVPWSALSNLGAGPTHVGTGDRGPVSAVVHAAPPPGSAPPTQAAIVATIAANGLHGSIADLLDAAVLLVQSAEVSSTSLEPKPFIELLKELGAADS